jgi:tripeptide aminopeptidase
LFPTSALSRFLQYVTIDTRSDEDSASTPSTPGQSTLLARLAAELESLGAADVTRDDHGHVMATVPATVRGAVPVIGFIAHVDTSPDVAGANVRPIIHRAWSGHDIVLPAVEGAILRAEHDGLAAHRGHDIVTASGDTLLGADDKAGVAEIMAAAEHLLRHPEIGHGTIRIAFTPDEEIGRGTTHFDVERFGAFAAYTVDGGEVGELEIESFSADALTVTFHGFNTHPGYAKGKMVNAIRVAATFVDALPLDRLSPETSDGYEGYIHPFTMHSSVERTSVRVLLRDFRTVRLREYRELVESAARAAVARHPGSRFDLVREEQYRNMLEVFDVHPQVVEHAADAIRRAGLEVSMRPIRGGTDGSRLSFMGLPTPNLFAGQHNIHSRLEWTSAQDMDAAVRVIVELAKIWSEDGDT